ncbi:MAG TPA: response regulator [Pyrinomonadaceae bacterium]|nr:response regulator [Pyrinomonadaceae bacterium]
MIEKLQGQNSVPAQITSADAGARPFTVLLVEDDRSLRRYLEVVLRREGYEVIVAADGLEAMRATLTSAVDIVVTDAIMPNLNGHELVRFLRNTPQLSHLPIVLLSALEAQDTQSSDQRADVYLSKPISPEVLTDCLEGLLGKN